ncbi:aminotransferase class I/II-fold pyridoxal phosphate-dependent enzyme [Pseudoalteromonas tunicata]|jgi:8-amino-7-oxononanoate synthase|uniref:8-amino-7-oxononanoate synthase n=1 Tax=Pseudoalteromonas tunicata D2 TaxID=87626 RepID=A4C9J0_9GAMM|nr:8-amino-7-oxononanoate synthase [Pseudoalteromonas tunicata]ATC94595.1 8-amino-7-oxononanoate synthase [Pseudoalteromonas tunicata]AXT30321.1 8-amino-7-oxononanoate synthase [Pseudoalteromonas tunicata]EAR28048.1 8-amino-7-oxononanoate synthase (7-keto-8-aminopelargonic acid synthetase) [Pseudoalteromonas tunicata D2]
MAFDYIACALALRKKEALLRERVLITSSTPSTMTVAGREYINFASNDYLGLAATSTLAHSSATLGSKSSALVTGYHASHAELERFLCQTLGYDACLLFTSGFSANSSVLKTLMSAPDSEIFQDKLNHASLIDGGLAAKAAMTRFHHNDMNHLRAKLEKSKANNKLIVSEGVFSMDGDLAPIDALAELAKSHDAWLMIDDAHGFGVLGKNGLGSCFVDGNAIRPELLIITFGKAVGSSGAALLCSTAVKDFMLQFNRDYIYSTSMSPMVAHSTLIAVQSLVAANAAREKLAHNIALFRHLASEAKLALMNSDTAIQPLIIGDADTTLLVSQQLKTAGFWVGAIRPPTVPVNTARLRITLTAAHSDEQIVALVDQLKRTL